MGKLELMDSLLDQHHHKMTSVEIFEIVDRLFGFDLTATPVLYKDYNALGPETTSRRIIDEYMEGLENELKGSEIREMINKMFGINLEAVAKLDGKRISLYSKNQWILQNDTDLFVVYTGPKDVDVKIYPTPFFTAKTGLKRLPDELSTLLEDLGYHYNTKLQSHYYSNPTGEAVSDQFKGQTMMSISKVIQSSYFHL